MAKDGSPAVKIIRPKEKRSTNIYSTSSAGRPIIESNMSSKDNILHRSMGHVNKEVIEHMVKDPSYGMNEDVHLEKCNWEACVQTRGTKQSAAGKIAERSEEKAIHADVCNPFKQEPFGGKQSVVTCLITLDRYTNVKLIKGREEALAHAQNFISWLNRSTGQMVKRVPSVDAVEFLCVKENPEEKGKILTTSTPYTRSQMNWQNE